MFVELSRKSTRTESHTAAGGLTPVKAKGPVSPVQGEHYSHQGVMVSPKGPQILFRLLKNILLEYMFPVELTAYAKVIDVSTLM